MAPANLVTGEIQAAGMVDFDALCTPAAEYRRYSERRYSDPKCLISFEQINALVEMSQRPMSLRSNQTILL